MRKVVAPVLFALILAGCSPISQPPAPVHYTTYSEVIAAARIDVAAGTEYSASDITVVSTYASYLVNDSGTQIGNQSDVTFSYPDGITTDRTFRCYFSTGTGWFMVR